jgi:hypothetical protein
MKTSKKLVLLLTACFLICGAAISQAKIQFKGKELVLAGISAGAVKGKNDNPSFYECFVGVDPEDTSIICSTVQTFNKDLDQANNKDLEVKKVALKDLNLDLLNDIIEPTTDMFDEPCYILHLYTIDNKDLVKSTVCWRFSEGSELQPGDDFFSMMIVFKFKTEAESFVKALKSVK